MSLPAKRDNGLALDQLSSGKHNVVASDSLLAH